MNQIKSVKLLETLVSTHKLKHLLKNEDVFMKSFRLIDANVGSKARRDYEEGHIENAVYMDTMECVEPSKLYPRDIPKKQCFQNYIGSLGISNDHHIIVYDRSPFGFLASSRIWWQFKYFGHENVSVLNGGINRWMRDFSHLSTKIPNYNQETFVIKENKSLLTTYDQILDNIKNRSSSIVDARPPQDFNGKSDSAKPAEINHIPGSMNIPYDSLFDKDNICLKGKDELIQLFEKVSNKTDGALIGSCVAGMTACSVLLAADIVGFTNLSLYLGSWYEFSQR